MLLREKDEYVIRITNTLATELNNSLLTMKLTPPSIYIKKARVKECMIILTVLLVAIYPLHSVVANYISGDQIHYRYLYERYAHVSSWNEIFVLARQVVSSNEIVSPLVLWVGSFLGFEKDAYVTVLNLILLAALLAFLRTNRVSWVLVTLFATNFYLMVLFTGAERLKLGYLFILLAALTAGRARILLTVISFLAHFLMILLGIPVALYFRLPQIIKSIRRIAHTLTISRQQSFNLLSSLVVCAALLVIPGVVSGIVNKAHVYIELSSLTLSDLYQGVVLSVSFAVVQNKRFKVEHAFFISMFLLLIIILGGQRVNMIYFSAVMFVLVYERRASLKNPAFYPFVLILIYLSLKSIGFIENVYTYGHGFPIK